MVEKGNVPKNPLNFIKDCVRNNRLMWTWHINMRMKDRFIARETIIRSVESFEIIESYPEDKYLPSYLVYAYHNNKVFHVLFAADVKNNNVRVVTAYYPAAEKWSEDLKRRKKS